ncbi:MAG: Ada metal-binding domain-containing protein [Nitrospirae bacterium]|nr:MAG: Ada metal-binding domain-containing protein [Nitrospirota bacterium]
MKLRKVLGALLAAAAAAMVVALWPRRRGVVGNERSRVYHDPACRLAPAPERAVRFGSAAAAEAAGYRPCGVCLGG